MWKKIIIISSFLFIFPLVAHQQVTSEQVDVFKAKIEIQSDTTVKVQETILYNFGSSERHGIYRNIPYVYNRKGAKYTLRVMIQSVKDENGRDYKFTQSRSGGMFEIKIGDSKTYVSGEKTYVIEYTVNRAINYFEQQDEFYWNVTGNGWEVPIQSASAEVTLPNNAAPKEIICYTGQTGSTLTNCTKNIKADKSAEFIAQSLLAFQGLTIDVAIKKGVLAKPTGFESAKFFLIDNWYFVIPILVWLCLHWLWLKKGKDPKGRGTIVPQYEPPLNLMPGELGTLWDEKADSKEVSATIINLAVKGYLKIKDLGNKNYEFIRLKEDTNQSNPIEKQVMDALFKEAGSAKSVELKSLKNKFYLDLTLITKALYESMASEGFFSANPQTVKGKYIGIGFGVCMFGFMIVQIQSSFFVVSAFLAFILSGILFIIYGSFMPQKTIKGAETQEEIKGFRWFLSVTETERLKFHNAPAKKPEQFEKFLPYAMVLEVEKEWAKQFEGMMLSQPGWYEGQPGAVFNAVYFGSIMSGMNHDMNSSLASRPSSAGSGTSGFGGGGFSGGGFGGGGGGSW
ncbi:MAG: DUF2207 domain-containing protein [Patescibacteria group bacterium]|jgi:uncharacterized membrane protein